MSSAPAISKSKVNQIIVIFSFQCVMWIMWFGCSQWWFTYTVGRSKTQFICVTLKIPLGHPKLRWHYPVSGVFFAHSKSKFLSLTLRRATRYLLSVRSHFAHVDKVTSEQATGNMTWRDSMAAYFGCYLTDTDDEDEIFLGFPQAPPLCGWLWLKLGLRRKGGYRFVSQSADQCGRSI